MLGATTAVRAQRGTDRQYAREPRFIAMLDDTLANYYEVERAFTLYFRSHVMPEGEHEEIGERREREKMPSRRARRRIAAESKLRFGVKKYHFWRRQMEPYVQDDGRILTPSERLAIHRAQKG